MVQRLPDGSKGAMNDEDSEQRDGGQVFGGDDDSKRRDGDDDSDPTANYSPNLFAIVATVAGGGVIEQPEDDCEEIWIIEDPMCDDEDHSDRKSQKWLASIKEGAGRGSPNQNVREPVHRAFTAVGLSNRGEHRATGSNNYCEEDADGANVSGDPVTGPLLQVHTFEPYIRVRHSESAM